MENFLFVFVVVFLAYAIYSQVQIVKAKRKLIRQQECNEQLLDNFRSIIENLPVVEYVVLENFVKSQYCDDDGDESIVYPITANSSEAKESQESAEKRLMWNKIYNKLFN